MIIFAGRRASSFTAFGLLGVLSCLTTTTPIHSFVIPFGSVPSSSSTTKTTSKVSELIRYGIIRADDKIYDKEDMITPPSMQMAMDAVVKLKGDIKHGPGKADTTLVEDLFRYKNLTLVDKDKVEGMFQKVEASILCEGSGKEDYVDPGETTNKVVYLAPDEAMKNALAAAGSVEDADTLVYNFLGGEHVMIGEVLDACKAMTLKLGVPTKTKVYFNSASFKDIPEDLGTLVVVAMRNSKKKGGDEEETPMYTGAEKAILNGEIYAYDGKLWTLDEGDLLPDDLRQFDFDNE